MGSNVLVNSRVPKVFLSMDRMVSSKVFVFPILLLLAGVVGAEPDAEKARKSIAKSSMRNLALTLEICALDTTFYVSLETLNDIGLESFNNPHDFINNEGGTFVMRPARGVFELQRRDLLKSFNRWQGPYINYQQGTTQTDPGPYDFGSPLDPWFTPYYFFSPLGLVRGDIGAVTQEL